jgi:hypothetical protein
MLIEFSGRSLKMMLIGPGISFFSRNYDNEGALFMCPLAAAPDMQTQ